MGQVCEVSGCTGVFLDIGTGSCVTEANFWHDWMFHVVVYATLLQGGLKRRDTADSAIKSTNPKSKRYSQNGLPHSFHGLEL